MVAERRAFHDSDASQRMAAPTSAQRSSAGRRLERPGEPPQGLAETEKSAETNDETEIATDLYQKEMPVTKSTIYKFA